MIRRLWAGLVAGPGYAPTDADRRTIDLVGLRLPRRATVALTVITLALLFDYSRTFIPADIRALGRASEGLRGVAIERAILFGLVPLFIVVLGFRDRLPRYGITLGDWRWGLGLMLAGCAVMTPIVLAFANLPDVVTYYGPSAAPVAELLLTNGLELTAAEFAFRGFLMLTLVRVMGPVGVLVATMPFVFGHLGKPELELFSTLAGGLIYGWLAWRTRSIVWGAIGHTYILTLVMVAASG
jgi:membrane protease YdiL (CAAX protease family)